MLAATDGRVTNLTCAPRALCHRRPWRDGAGGFRLFYIEGYFEETKLPRIHEGDP